MAMRLGTEDKKKRLIAGIMVSLALTLIAHTAWQLLGGPSDTNPVPAEVSTVQTSAPVEGPITRPASQGHAARQLESASQLDPTLHPERMAMAENMVYTGNSRNIFSKDSLPPVAIGSIEKPIASARPGGPSAPSGPPPPPPIDLKFYGFATDQGGAKYVFLLHGEDVFVAAQGDIVDRRYRILQVNSNSIVVEDLSYNHQQTLPLQSN